MTGHPATIDFETFSLAGFRWDAEARKWKALPGAPQNKKGLGVVGAAVYAEHPSTIILTLSYFIPGSPGVQRWRPGDAPPVALFHWIAAGGKIEAHNVMFERLIWWHVATRLHGWPPLIPENLCCSMATARVNNLPGALGDLGDVLLLPIKKDKEGTRLIKKFCIPRDPTKKDPRLWIEAANDEEGPKLYSYCDTDVLSEIAASTVMTPMSDAEREFWLVDQEINWRGLAIDRKGARDCIVILNQALARYGEEYRQITGGLEPTQLEATKGWLAGRGIRVSSMDADALEYWLAPRNPPLAPDVRRVFEIRDLIGSASVKKLFAMELTASRDDRIRNLIVHHGARTGRPTGEGAQPLNMPKEGPKLVTCGPCAKPFHPKNTVCPWCGASAQLVRRTKSGDIEKKWSPHMANDVLEIMAIHNLDLVEYFFDDAVLAIMGCVRSLFTGGVDELTGEELELIASDYSAIEAVIIAMLAGEQWRIDAFMQKLDIYLASAAKIMDRPGGVQWYLDWAAEHGENHPDRQKIGKVAELGLGFGGWINAWRVFDDTDTFTDDEVKEHIKAWRKASPAIVELWGGQWRGTPWNGVAERYGFEGAAINAIQYPGTVQEHRGIKFEVRQRTRPATNIGGVNTTIHSLGTSIETTLVITLLSGRELVYHEPNLQPSTRPYATPGELQIWYMTWNSNPKYGPLGWVPMQTFGGRITENVVQAIAHDILRYAILNLRRIGYPTVLHVYDEIVVERPARPPVPVGIPDPQIFELERVMSIMPPWAQGWPVRASGGWRGKRYRKA